MTMSELQMAYNGKTYKTYIYKLEHGLKPAGVRTIERLAKCLSVSPAWLSGWSDTKVES